MARSDLANNAFRNAQRLLDNTFEPFTTITRQDATKLAQDMKLDDSVTNLDGSPFNLNMNQGYEAEAIGYDTAESPITEEDLLPTKNSGYFDINPDMKLSEGLAGHIKPYDTDSPHQALDLIRKAAETLVPSTGATLSEDFMKIYDKQFGTEYTDIQGLVKDLETKKTLDDGYNEKIDNWSPHKSAEGGNRTIAYGHKLKDAEVKGSYVQLGNQQIPFSQVTDKIAGQVFDQDWSKATEEAEKWFTSKAWNKLDPMYQELATELMFNMGYSKVSNTKVGYKRFKAASIAGNKEEALKNIRRTYGPAKKSLRSRTDRLENHFTR